MSFGNGINIAAALLLFLLSSIMLYATWYIIHGRKRKKTSRTSGDQPGDEPDETHERRSNRKKKWGYSKNDYCYPGINDVMGFEFVKVVKLKDDAPSPVPAPAATGGKPDWEQSRGIGSLSTVSSTGINQETEEDEPFPENEAGILGRNGNGFQGRFQPKGQPDREEPSTDESEITNADFSTAEYEAAMAWNGWENHGEEIFPADDEYIDKMLNDHPDEIDNAGPDEENIRTIDEFEAYRKTLHEADKDYGETIDKLTDGLDFPDKDVDMNDIDIPDEDADDGGEEPVNEDVDFGEDEVNIEEE